MPQLLFHFYASTFVKKSLCCKIPHPFFAQKGPHRVVTHSIYSLYVKYTGSCKLYQGADSPLITRCSVTLSINGVSFTTIPSEHNYACGNHYFKSTLDPTIQYVLGTTLTALTNEFTVHSRASAVSPSSVGEYLSSKVSSSGTFAMTAAVFCPTQV